VLWQPDDVLYRSITIIRVMPSRSSQPSTMCVWNHDDVKIMRLPLPVVTFRVQVQAVYCVLVVSYYAGKKHPFALRLQVPGVPPQERELQCPHFRRVMRHALTLILFELRATRYCTEWYKVLIMHTYTVYGIINF
jgi:hypothetical protein